MYQTAVYASLGYFIYCCYGAAQELSEGEREEKVKGMVIQFLSEGMCAIGLGKCGQDTNYGSEYSLEKIILGCNIPLF